MLRVKHVFQARSQVRTTPAYTQHSIYKQTRALDKQLQDIPYSCNSKLATILLILIKFAMEKQRKFLFKTLKLSRNALLLKYILYLNIILKIIFKVKTAVSGTEKIYAKFWNVLYFLTYHVYTNETNVLSNNMYNYCR